MMRDGWGSKVEKVGGESYGPRSRAGMSSQLLLENNDAFLISDALLRTLRVYLKHSCFIFTGIYCQSHHSCPP
jgi:hypothetical protein